MSTLKYPTAIWSTKERGAEEFYGFPLGIVETSWGKEVVYPLLNDSRWDFKCVVPAGQPIESAREETGDRVAVMISGLRVHTGKWNIQTE